MSARRWQKLYGSDHIRVRTVKFFGDGSIEVGKRACLAVLNKDIFTIPDEEIDSIEPVCTFFDGQELHIPI